MANESELLDAREAAVYLKLNEQTVRRLAREKQIPAFKVGGSWRFKRSSLEEWAEEQQTLSEPKRMLVVDDEEPVRDFLSRVLERHGYQVRCAQEGGEALELMAEEVPDCVLLDLKMPGMDGPETLKRIRESYQALPVVILTGYPEIALVHRALQYTPVTLLSKPVTRDEILQAVKTLTG